MAERDEQIAALSVITRESCSLANDIDGAHPRDGSAVHLDGRSALTWMAPRRSARAPKPHG